MNPGVSVLRLALPLVLLSACVQGTPHDGTGGTSGGGKGGVSGAAGASGGGPGATGNGGAGGAGGVGVGSLGGMTGGGSQGGRAGALGGNSGNGQGGASGLGGRMANADGGTRPDLTGRKALFIVDNPSSLDDGDILFQQLLEIRGMTVTYGTVTGPASLATGYHLVVASSGASAADFATVFKDVPVPMILFSNTYFQPMGFAAAGNANRGNVASTVQLSIVDGVTPLASDLGMGATIGVISPLRNTQLYWGTPSGTVIKVASVVGAPTQVVDFAFERGATMAVGTAAARRVGLGWKTDAIKDLLIESFKLQDAAVSWTAAAP